jgi:hypothetical protein
MDIDLNQLDENLKSYFKDLDIIRLDQYLKSYLDIYVNQFHCMIEKNDIYLTTDLYCYETLDD